MVRSVRVEEEEKVNVGRVVGNEDVACLRRGRDGRVRWAISFSGNNILHVERVESEYEEQSSGECNMHDALQRATNKRDRVRHLI